MNRQAPGERLTEYSGEYDAFFDALKAGTARLALILGRRPGVKDELPPAYDYAERMRQRVPGLRSRTRRRSCGACARSRRPTSAGRSSAAPTSRRTPTARRCGPRSPSRYEYEVEAELERVYLQRGAPSWGYPSIVGSGPNATILHYDRSRRQMKAGELLLIDAAAFYEGMTADITRAWPVNGKYSKEQAELWRLVLAAQDAGMKAAVAGNHTTDVEKAAEEVVRRAC